MHGAHLAVILLLSISTNLDNLGVGVSYGLRGIDIPLIPNFLIGIMNSAGNLASMLLGEAIYSFVKPDYSKYVGASIIMCAGVWIIIQDIISKRGNPVGSEHLDSKHSQWCNKSVPAKICLKCRNPVAVDTDCNDRIDMGESFFLGLALTLSNIAGGVGAGMMGLSPTLTTVMIFMFSFLTIWVGLRVGHIWLARLLGNLTGLMAGAFLIFISVYEIVS